MKNFNIYDYLSTNNLELMTNFYSVFRNYYGVSVGKTSSYRTAFVEDKTTRKPYYLISHTLLPKSANQVSKTYYYLVDEQRNVTKLNGGKLGSSWVEDAEQSLYVRYTMSQNYLQEEA
jgi:hypothetical protein